VCHEYFQLIIQSIYLARNATDTGPDTMKGCSLH